MNRDKTDSSVISLCIAFRYYTQHTHTVVWFFITTESCLMSVHFPSSCVSTPSRSASSWIRCVRSKSQLNMRSILNMWMSNAISTQRCRGSMFSYSTDRGNQQHGVRGTDLRQLSTRVCASERYPTGECDKRRQGANRTSSDVHLENVRLETPPEVSVYPPQSEDTAQTTHTMLVKISQNSLIRWMGHYDKVEKGNYCRALLRVSDGRRTNRSRFSSSPTRARMISNIHSPHSSIGELHGSRKYTNPRPCFFYSVVMCLYSIQLFVLFTTPSGSKSRKISVNLVMRKTHLQYQRETRGRTWPDTHNIQHVNNDSLCFTPSLDDE